MKQPKNTDSHRFKTFYRQGEAFDRGETFSGVDFETGLQAVEALRWILMSPAVTCTFPGAKRPSQEEDNAAAADMPDPPAEVMAGVQAVYRQRIQPLVHHYW